MTLTYIISRINNFFINKIYYIKTVGMFNFIPKKYYCNIINYITSQNIELSTSQRFVIETLLNYKYIIVPDEFDKQYIINLLLDFFENNCYGISKMRKINYIKFIKFLKENQTLTNNDIYDNKIYENYCVFTYWQLAEDLKIDIHELYNNVKNQYGLNYITGKTIQKNTYLDLNYVEIDDKYLLNFIEDYDENYYIFFKPHEYNHWCEKECENFTHESYNSICKDDKGWHILLWDNKKIYIQICPFCGEILNENKI